MNGSSQILPVWIFLLLLSIKLISNDCPTSKYGLFIIAIPITVSYLGLKQADRNSPIFLFSKNKLSKLISLEKKFNKYFKSLDI